MTKTQLRYLNHALTSFGSLNASLGSLKANGAPTEMIDRLLDEIEECRVLIIQIVTFSGELK